MPQTHVLKCFRLSFAMLLCSIQFRLLVFCTQSPLRCFGLYLSKFCCLCVTILNKQYFLKCDLCHLFALCQPKHSVTLCQPNNIFLVWPIVFCLSNRSGLLCKRQNSPPNTQCIFLLLSDVCFVRLA